MAKRVTEEDIILMNNLYIQYGTYAEVSRQCGFSASTVKKYIIPNYTPIAAENIIRFDKVVLDDYSDFPRTPEEWQQLLRLTKQEETELEELRKDIVL